MLFRINSTPLKFCMSECEEKTEVKRLITENGGLFLNIWEKGAIMIVPYDKNFRVRENSDYDQVSYKYIYDSVALQTLQPINEYLLEVIKPSKKINSVKIAYTDDEDRIMREYVRAQNGNPVNLSFWNTFRFETGSMRTADSLRAHWKILTKKHEIELKVQKNVDVKQSYIVKKPGKPLSIAFEHEQISSKNDQKVIDITSECPGTLKQQQSSMQKKKSKDLNITTTNEINILQADKYKNQNSEEKMEILDENCIEKDDLPEKILDKEVTIKDKVMSSNIETIKIMESINAEIKAKPGKELNEMRIEELFDNLVDLCRLKNKITLSPEEIIKALIYFNGNVQETVNFFALNNKTISD
ncbi:hypothetical protein SteCoe_24969 [Stentor coeruleus]|uniref:BRCT domain-containing protein n=1 Tax=Stentor coeruleus TaxID=5963 RepID=A0A1R2BGB2_9CILI|nr:hypothetical protein SteCoe_24969 [Stentor coeruleus]